MTDTTPCELISWNEFENLSWELARQIRASGFAPDMIVAIGRGGYLPARMLSDSLGLMDLASMRILHYRGTHKEPVARVEYPLNAGVGGRRVLLVDDVSDSGDTFAVAMDHLSTRGRPEALRTVALHHKTTSHFEPDFFAKKITHWRWLIYPWAITEDITGLVKQMYPEPESLEEIARRLDQAHGIRLPYQRLTEILTMM